jgi:V/A-type H+-transporting ATPase subunit K
MENAAVRLKRRITLTLIALFSILAISGTLFTHEAFAQKTDDESVGTAAVSSHAGPSDSKAMWGFMAAAIAFGLGAIGAGIAISNVGAAAMGAVAEKPEVAGQALIFVALAEGLVVFGFIMALLILGKV